MSETNTDQGVNEDEIICAGRNMCAVYASTASQPWLIVDHEGDLVAEGWTRETAIHQAAEEIRLHEPSE